MKTKNYLIIICLLCVSISAFSQSFLWGGRFGGSGEDVVKKMHVDAAGNSYVTGYFTDTADFDISSAEVNLTAVGMYDAFVQKTNAAGALDWAVSFGGSMFEYGTGITTDTDGNVYITGYFDETVDFDPGAGEFLLTSQGSGDIFIVKLNSDGEFIWARSIGGPDYEESTSIGVDEIGNVYVLGYLYETMDFDPGPAEVLMGSQGLSDTFLLKLNSSGDFANVFTYGGDETDLALDLAVKSSSQIFISGFFGGTTDLDPRPAEEYLVSATEGFGGYTMQIDNTGTIVQVATTAGGDVSVYAVSADAQNNMYITGSFSGTVNFDPTSGNSDFTFTSDEAYNAFILKVTADGSVAWARRVSSVKPVFAYDIVVGGDGMVYATGFFEGPADFNPAAADEFLLSKESPNPMDAYLLALDPDGLFVNAFQFGGVGFIDTHQLGIDAASNIYLSAQFETSVDINPLSEETETVVAMDFRDNYLIKMTLGALGIPEVDAQNISLYPNPTSESLYLAGSENLEGKSYFIFNLLGQKIAEGVLGLDQKVDVSTLQSGLYLLNFQDGKGVKFIKK